MSNIGKDTRLRLIQLDGIRGICALMVAIYHFAGHDGIKSTPVLSNFIVMQGDLFVDFFFVLSGFVISLNYAGKITDFKQFKDYLSKRFIRLYPLLFYTTLVYFLFELIINLFLPHLLNSTQSVSGLLLQAADSLLFQDSTPLLGKNPGINYPSWSISAEMISYIVFGLIIMYFKKWAKYALGILLISSVAFLISLDSYMETYAWGFMRGITCFITGFYTYTIFKKCYGKYTGNFWPYALCILTVALLYIRSNLESKDLFTLLTVPPVFALLILSFSLSHSFPVRLMSNRLFQWLGKISYSIYLNHAILLTIISKAAFKLLGLEANAFNIYAVLAIYIAAILIYSQLTYRFIEVKGKELLLRFTTTKKDKEEKKPGNYKAA
jgi:peptidoglycan/LPS O-acetylase OafA/YrhL